MKKTAYAYGFARRCIERGVSPDMMLKAAQAQPYDWNSINQQYQNTEELRNRTKIQKLRDPRWGLQSSSNPIVSDNKAVTQRANKLTPLSDDDLKEYASQIYGYRALKPGDPMLAGNSELSDMVGYRNLQEDYRLMTPDEQAKLKQHYQKIVKDFGPTGRGPQPGQQPVQQPAGTAPQQPATRPTSNFRDSSGRVVVGNGGTMRSAADSFKQLYQKHGGDKAKMRADPAYAQIQQQFSSWNAQDKAKFRQSAQSWINQQPKAASQPTGNASATPQPAVTQPTGNTGAAPRPANPVNTQTVYPSTSSSKPKSQYVNPGKVVNNGAPGVNSLFNLNENFVPAASAPGNTFFPEQKRTYGVNSRGTFLTDTNRNTFQP